MSTRNFIKFIKRDKYGKDEQYNYILVEGNEANLKELHDDLYGNWYIKTDKLNYELDTTPIPENEIDVLLKRLRFYLPHYEPSYTLQKYDGKFDYIGLFKKKLFEEIDQKHIAELCSFMPSLRTWMDEEDEEDEKVEEKQYVVGQKPSFLDSNKVYKIYIQWSGNESEIDVLANDVKQYAIFDFTLDTENKIKESDIVLDQNSMKLDGVLNYIDIKDTMFCNLIVGKLNACLEEGGIKNLFI